MYHAIFWVHRFVKVPKLTNWCSSKHRLGYPRIKVFLLTGKINRHNLTNTHFYYLHIYMSCTLSHLKRHTRNITEIPGCEVCTDLQHKHDRLFTYVYLKIELMKFKPETKFSGLMNHSTIISILYEKMF